MENNSYDPIAEICAECAKQGLSVYECAEREYARCEMHGQPPDQCAEYANIIVERCKQFETKEPEETEEKPKEALPAPEPFDICKECAKLGLSIDECEKKEYTECVSKGLPPKECAEMASLLVDKCRLKSMEQMKTATALIALGIGGLVLLGLLSMWKRG